MQESVSFAARLKRLTGFTRNLRHSLVSICLLTVAANDGSQAAVPEPQAANKAASGKVTVYLVLREPPAVEVWQQEHPKRGPVAAREAVRQRLAEIDTSHAALRPGLAAAGAREIGRVRNLANAVRVQVAPGKLQALSRLPGVARVQPARKYTRATASSVPHSGATAVWADAVRPADGSGIRVGIIDSGIDYTHAAFGGSGGPDGFLQNDGTVIEPGSFPTAKVVGGYDFVGDDYNANDSATDLPAPDPDPLDTSNGHGTSVAGIVAGFGVTKSGATFTGSYTNGLNPDLFSIGPGLAPRAQLYALKVFGREGSTMLAAEAIDWAADPNGDGDFSDRLDVVNLSLGSDFGLATEKDVDVAAADNLARLGCVVVCSAGNAGNSFYVVGGPSTAPRVLSVANLLDQTGAIEVTTPVGTTPYTVTFGGFGPHLNDLDPVVGSVVYAEPYDACTSFTEPDALAGNIALVDRGTCYFIDKVRYAEEAGAIAVIVANNVPGSPVTMGLVGADDVNIPSVMISQSDGQRLKDALLAGEVVARLDASIVNPADRLRDTLASSSSRGPAAPGHLLKPEIAATGDGVFTPAVGTGSKGRGFSGTSSAAPHVAGAAALLKHLHPGWSAETIKAALMNTSIPVRDPEAIPYPETRSGAGRIAVHRAAATRVTASSDRPDGRVAVTFGALELVEPATFTERVRLTNFSSAPLQFTVTVSNTVTESGVTVTASPASVTVPALGSATVDLVLSANPALFDRTFDSTTPMRINDQARAGVHEVSGQLWLHHPENPLHLPFYAAVRAAAERWAAGHVAWPADSNPAVAIPVDGRSAHPQPLVSAFQLGYRSQSSGFSRPDEAAADVIAAGAACNAASVQNFNDSTIFFGIATAGPWSSPNLPNVGLMVEIDRDLNRSADAVIYNSSQANISAEDLWDGGSGNDVLVTAVGISSEITPGLPLNYFPPDARDTVLFNTRVLVLPVPVASLNLPAGKTRLNYRLTTTSNQSIDGNSVKETPWITFDAALPGVDTARGLDGTPFFATGPVTAVVNGTAFSSYTQIPAILLLHHMNTTPDQVQVVGMAPRVTIDTAGGETNLRWDTPGSYAVEVADSLTPPVVWKKVATAQGRYRLSTSTPGPRFYRVTLNL